MQSKCYALKLNALLCEYIFSLHSRSTMRVDKTAYDSLTKLVRDSPPGPPEQVTTCCEPLQKMRVRLSACGTGLSRPVILYY